MKRAFILRSVLLATASIAAVPIGAAAQTDAASVETPVETVTVTGSRVGGNGFQTPTPVTVTSAEILQNAAPSDLADGLNQLPQFAGSNFATTGGNTGVTGATGGNSQNLLSLRGLGPTRTLVLLDGRRLPGTNLTGSTDIDDLPQNLVSHVDVVTGGASAAYGSDAIAGVVNFALNTKFEGLKGDIHSGVSTYGDSPLFDGSVAYGFSFSSGRGRNIASFEYFLEGGIGILDDNRRDWWIQNSGYLANPVVGATPGIIKVDHLAASLGTAGGLITSGPLKGTQFQADGSVGAPFNPGTLSGSHWQNGGDGYPERTGLTPDQRRTHVFDHVEYDITDWMTLFAEGGYSKVTTRQVASYLPEVGSGNQFTIFSGNPYIPTGLQAQMTAGNIASFPLGKYLTDFPPQNLAFYTEVKRVLAGAKGDFGLFSGNWHYDAYYQNGGTNEGGGQYNEPILRNIYAAADAVRDPASGNIVCRSTLNGFTPGCVPLNLFGTAPVSAAQVAYSFGNSIKDLHMQQQLFAVNLNGDLGPDFNLGAGPINVATGFEYRRESTNQTVDAVSQTQLNANYLAGVRGIPSSIVTANRLGGFQFNNPQPLNGHYDVKEFYGEVGIPLLHDLPGAEVVDLNGAARYTDYSESGGVVTWKYGLNWLVIDDIRLRGTVSQDIRGPNVLELFNSQSTTQNAAIYPVSTAGQTTPTTVISSGNPNLVPEKALTQTYGMVLAPRWIPGLQASVDYYKIKINDAIATPAYQIGIIDQCFHGNTQACTLITVQAGGSLIIHAPEENLTLQQTAGYDFESSYSMDIFGGNLSLRALANQLLQEYSVSPGTTVPISTRAEPASPRWKGTVSASFTMDNLTLFAQERWIAASVIDPSYSQGVNISDNTIPAIFYTDLTVKYRMPFAFLGDNDQEFYVTVNNLFNQAPPVSGVVQGNYSVPPNPVYDEIGRYFTVGLRISVP